MRRVRDFRTLELELKNEFKSRLSCEWRRRYKDRKQKNKTARKSIVNSNVFQYANDQTLYCLNEAQNESSWKLFRQLTDRFFSTH